MTCKRSLNKLQDVYANSTCTPSGDLFFEILWRVLYFSLWNQIFDVLYFSNNIIHSCIQIFLHLYSLNETNFFVYTSESITIIYNYLHCFLNKNIRIISFIYYTFHLSITLFIKFLQNLLHLAILIKISWKLMLQIKYLSDVEINLPNARLSNVW